MLENSLPSLHVIAPDEGAGRTFRQGLSQNEKLTTTIQFATISPRVVEGRLTTDVDQVVRNLADEILAAIYAGHSRITISCNTLSLPVFINRATELVEQALVETQFPMPHIILTVQEIAQYLETNKNKKVLLLGTKPLSQILGTDDQQDYRTLLQYQSPFSNDLDLVQEIIWRVKALQNSDTTTAPVYESPLYPPDTNRQALNQKLEELHHLLLSLKVDEVIMACTELPDAFKLLQDHLLQNDLPYLLIDPAELVGKAATQ